jgi:inosine-uridine nucleoside N-ribohydrolase
MQDLEEDVRPPVGVIFDCHMGSRIDDVLALALLYGLEGKNEARVASISVTKPNLKAAALCEIMARFYTRDAEGMAAWHRPMPPIGLATGGADGEDTEMLTIPLEQRSADGAPLLVHSISRIKDTADPATLIRNTLLSLHDQNGLVVLTGPATNLARLLDLPGMKELITAKVRSLSVCAGTFPEGGPDFNISRDVTAARRLFNEWPTPIVAVGSEVGSSLLFPATSIERDFNWTAAHPVVAAYRAYHSMPYDAQTGAMAASLSAVRPTERAFQVSEPGTISISEEGQISFLRSIAARHRFLTLNRSAAPDLLQSYTHLVSARPVPRKSKHKTQQVELKDKDIAKPPESKPPNPAKTPN